MVALIPTARRNSGESHHSGLDTSGADGSAACRREIMAFDQTKRKGSVAAILPRRGSENWSRSAVDGVRSMEPCHGDNIGAVKKGAVVGRRRDEGVGQEFGGWRGVGNEKYCCGALLVPSSKTRAKDE